MRLAACLLLLLAAVDGCHAVGLAKGLYCGEEICYDVLGVSRENFDKATLAKAYRNLARKYHPDRVKGADDADDLAYLFRRIATAYETLKDDETRSYYDYYLDHPEERYYNYYQYYRLRAAPKVDVRLVILGTILLISAIQYLSALQKYSEALQYAKDQLKFRNMAVDIARERRLLEFDKQGKVKKRQSSGVDIEAVIGRIIEEKINISGGYRPASIKDTLLYTILYSPVTFYHAARFWSAWALKYWVRKEEYDDAAKLYLIRRNLKTTEEQINALEDEVVDDYFAHELWKKDEFARWKAAKEEEEREKLANSARYKQYRRYMRKQAGNTISFLDE